MTNLTLHRAEQSQAIVLPQPRLPGAINIRTATPDDFVFIDKLQKMHGNAVGFLQRPIIEKNIADGHVLIAEGTSGSRECLGYLISHDRYFKRDDVGIIYQLNVTPGSQRGLIGASLIREAFERSSYSCKLYCCWCAQDLEANYFWESLGFVPLAFRTGSPGRGKKEPRIHMFWQRRIREGDDVTPYWYPSQTSAGAVRANRIVLPIPPGTHWSDAKPAVLPGMEKLGERRALEGEVEKPKRKRKTCGGAQKKAEQARVEQYRRSSVALGGLRFDPLPPPPPEVVEEKAEEVEKDHRRDACATKPKKPAEQYDPKLIAAARELCGRYLDAVNESEAARMLPGAYGKYDVSRAFADAPGSAPGSAPGIASGIAPNEPVRAVLDGDCDDIIDAEIIDGECRLLDAA